MNQATVLLEDEVRELIRRRGLDPARDLAGVRSLVADAVADYDSRSVAGLVPPLVDPEQTAKDVVDAVAGLGPLQRFLDDPTIEEVWINEPGKVFVARAGRSELTTTILTEQQVHELVERMLRISGRRLDLSSPFVDASLATGERVHVVIPDITRAAWAVNIRKYIARAGRVSDLVVLGSLTTQAAAFLEAAVVAGMNILVSGATQAGKTTMVNALAGAIPAHERIITCEVGDLDSRIVRVVGNNAVHPGQIDVDADDEWLGALFMLMNLIVEQMIARPKHIQSLMAKLPSGALDAIARRDGSSATP